MKRFDTLAWTGLLALAFSPVNRAAVYTNPADVPSKTYDFIVVGAGTAGNVIASRLSEDSSKNVLVIEAGIDDTGIQSVEIPFFAPALQSTLVDWNYSTVAQPALNGRSLTVPRGFVLGGSSAINYMVWNRAGPDYWNKLASITGDSGWGWDQLESYWKKIATLVSPTSNPDITPDLLPTSEGNGPVLVDLPNFSQEEDQRVIEASKSLESQDERFKFTTDWNSGDPLGFGYNEVAAGHGTRSTSATAYLHPALQSRSNLDLLIQTRVTKLRQSSTSSTIPVFNGVEVAQSASASRVVFTARSEIILSAGTIGTAQLLLLSGIGPKADLGQVVVNSPDVGKNVREHPLLNIFYSVNSNDTFDDALRNATLTGALIQEWADQKTGLFSNTPTNTLGFMRLPDSFFSSSQPDPASGPDAANTELIPVYGFASTPTLPMPSVGHFFTMIVAVVSPESVGSIKLASTNSDTFTNPVIDYQLLSSDFDVQAMLQAITDTETFLADPAFTKDGFIIEPFGEWGNATTTELKLEYMRNHADTIHHPVGSAKMGKSRPSNPLGGDGVVDSRLRVRGVQGLRVVDASVLPIIPECHPMAVIYVVAERAADLIKEDNGLAKC